MFPLEIEDSAHLRFKPCKLETDVVPRPSRHNK